MTNFSESEERQELRKHEGAVLEIMVSTPHEITSTGRVDVDMFIVHLSVTHFPRFALFADK